MGATLLILGLAEIALGVILALTAALPEDQGVYLPPWTRSLLTNLGVGFIAAGITTLTIEYFRKNQTQKELSEFREAHFESILKGIIHKDIFGEVKSQIITHPYIRRNFQMTAKLYWKDESKARLIKEDTSIWDIENVSQQKQTYTVWVGKSQDSPSEMSEYVAVKEVRIDIEGNESILTGEDLIPYLEIGEFFVRAKIPVDLPPGKTAKILTSTTNIHMAHDTYMLFLTAPSVNLRASVSHPNDLDVGAFAMHPSKHLLIKEIDKDDLKQWRFDGGFLPYQGIKMVWAPMGQLMSS